MQSCQKYTMYYSSKLQEAGLTLQGVTDVPVCFQVFEYRYVLCFRRVSRLTFNIILNLQKFVESEY